MSSARTGEVLVLVLIGALLVLIPAIAIAYPFVRRRHGAEMPEDERSTAERLQTRWETALAGLKSAELEWAIGNLAESDYRWLRERYMTDAALVMKAMELEEQQEQGLLTTMRKEVQQARGHVDGSGSIQRPEPAGE